MTSTTAPAPKPNEETSMSESKWYSSGRGIFCRDAGFQLATMPMTVNWQEDTARIVDLLNKGESLDAERAARIEAEAKVAKLTGMCEEAAEKLRDEYQDHLEAERRREDATAKRIAEWLRGVGTGSDAAFCNTLAEMVERGDWRKR